MPQGSGSLLYLAILVVAFYLLIIRPQMQRTKQMRELLASLEIGDRVVTIGGLHGAIVEMVDPTVVLRVAEGVELTFEKGSIARKEVEAPEASESTPAGEEGEA